LICWGNIGRVVAMARHNRLTLTHGIMGAVVAGVAAALLFLMWLSYQANAGWYASPPQGWWGYGNTLLVGFLIVVIFLGFSTLLVALLSRYRWNGRESTSPTQGSSSPASLPPWPMVPLTAVECTDPRVALRMASSSGLKREQLLVFSLDLPGVVTSEFGLAGASVWRIGHTEGERQIAPGEVDRIGKLIEEHLGGEGGRAVVLGGIEQIVDAVSLKNARRLLQVSREIAQSTKGAVLFPLNKNQFNPHDLAQLEEGAGVISLMDVKD